MNDDFFKEFEKNEKPKKQENAKKETSLNNEYGTINKVAKWFKYDAVVSFVCGLITILFVITSDISFIIPIILIGNASICFAIGETIQILHDIRNYLKR